jgi:hypothetical protein
MHPRTASPPPHQNQRDPLVALANMSGAAAVTARLKVPVFATVARRFALRNEDPVLRHHGDLITDGAADLRCVSLVDWLTLS